MGSHVSFVHRHPTKSTLTTAIAAAEVTTEIHYKVDHIRVDPLVRCKLAAAVDVQDYR